VCANSATTTMRARPVFKRAVTQRSTRDATRDDTPSRASADDAPRRHERRERFRRVRHRPQEHVPRSQRGRRARDARSARRTHGERGGEAVGDEPSRKRERLERARGGAKRWTRIRRIAIRRAGGGRDVAERDGGEEWVRTGDLAISRFEDKKTRARRARAWVRSRGEGNGGEDYARSNGAVVEGAEGGRWDENGRSIKFGRSRWRAATRRGGARLGGERSSDAAMMTDDGDIATIQTRIR